MKKTFLAMALCVAIFGADESGYVLEADGEFGKELEALVNKYEGNATVRVTKRKEDKSTKDGRSKRLINIGVDKGQDFNLARGEELYLAKCAHCHGEKGEKSAYGESRKLKDMSAQQITDAIIGYANNPQYGGDKNNIMQPFAVAVNYRDLGDIISYIKGENAFVYTNEANQPISRKPTAQGTYIE